MEIHRRFTVILSLGVLLSVHHLQLLAFDIEGRINVAPPWPKIQKITVKKDQGSCGHSQESQAFLISKEGYLQNVVVWLEGRFDDKAAVTPSRPVLDQKSCHFDPHILLVPQGQSFLIGNRDPVGHDVRAFDGSRMLFRFEMEPHSDPVEKKFEKSGRFVIRCGLHPWMHAYVISTDHPYYSLSDADGKFYLRDVPKGNYALRIWHERLGDIKIPIELSKSVTDFSYTFPSALNESRNNEESKTV